jgi:uncharacterized protein YbjT (DUF2867 family)
MILVTGAAGKTGLAAIRALAARGQPLRALVRSDEQARRVRAAGVQETVIGDMADPEKLAEACQGARAVYHIPPNLSEVEISLGQGVIAAARAAGVEHVVYHSVLHPQVEAMPHHWHKVYVEAALFESGLIYTILQPAAYVQNVLAGWDQIVEQGVYGVPYSVQTRLGMVDLADVAQAAALVLTTPGHEGATYELAGPEVLAQTEVAALLSRHLGRPVRAEQIPIDRWTEAARRAGLGEYQIDALLKMFAYYERYGFWGNPRVLGQLLGRAPNDFEAFLRRIIQERDG